MDELRAIPHRTRGVVPTTAERTADRWGFRPPLLCPPPNKPSSRASVQRMLVPYKGTLLAIAASNG
jgi:hypothetical protein